jgi:UPF0755 protein
MTMTGIRIKINTRLLVRVMLPLLLIAVVAGTAAGSLIWARAFRPNVTTGGELTAGIHIPTGSDIYSVFEILRDRDLIRDLSSLEWVAKRKNYHKNVRPGYYRLREGMSNNELINMLRAGNQATVKVVFISQRSVNDIAAVISRQIEADSSEIAALAVNHEFIESLGFDMASLPALFIPNTYDFYWNTSAEQFYRRMKREYERFWNSEREEKRKLLRLSRQEVSTLASIVSEETVKGEEMPVIAGVYINRIRRGMPLQADPTIKFALGDFSVNRILRVHLEIDSPYNTYRNAGLPPGPIVIPPVQAIEAVLNAQEHEYIYFCAREDFSGYHRFARTLGEHNRNARLYQNALNQRRVFR